MQSDAVTPAPDAASEPRAKPARRPFHLSLRARLRAYLIAGILITAPIGITFYLVWLVVSFIDDRVSAVLPARYNPESYLPFSVPGLGLVIALVALIVIGALTAGIVGRAVIKLSESLLARMPVVRSVYGATKQIFETVLAQKSTAFRQVCLVEYPGAVVWTLGFVTGTTVGEVQALTSDEVVNVFLPTTPEPDLRIPSVRAAPGSGDSRDDHRGGHQDGRLRRHRDPARASAASRN